MKINRRRILFSLWLTGLLAPFLWLARLFFGTPSVIEVSPETTFLVGEKLADGSLDFSDALWRHCNRTIDDRLNAGIELSQLPPVKNLYQLHVDASREELNAAASDRRRLIRNEFHARVQHSVRRPWTRKQLPVSGIVLDQQADYIRQWYDAVRKPQLVKPQGVTIDTLSATIGQGAKLVFTRAMLAAGEGRWSDAIVDLKAIDHAAELLGQLQCGWEVEDACQLYTFVTESLTNVVLDSEHVDPSVAEFIRERADSSWHEILSRAVDHAIRIKFQLLVRDTREQPHRMASLIGRAIVGTNEKARELQINRVRNTIEWSTVSRIQNEVVSKYATALAVPDVTRWRDKWAEADLFIDKNHNNDLLAKVKTLELAQISNSLAWQLARSSKSRYLGRLYRARFKLHRQQQGCLIALAIAEYRHQHGDYPQTQKQLLQQLKTSVPEFPFPTSSLTYEVNDSVVHVTNEWGTVLHHAPARILKPSGSLAAPSG